MYCFLAIFQNCILCVFFSNRCYVAHYDVSHEICSSRKGARPPKKKGASGDKKLRHATIWQKFDMLAEEFSTEEMNEISQEILGIIHKHLERKLQKDSQ